MLTSRLFLSFALGITLPVFATSAAFARSGNGCDNNPSSYCGQNSPLNRANTSAVASPSGPTPVYGQACYQGRCYTPSAAMGVGVDREVEDNVSIAFRENLSTPVIETAFQELRDLATEVAGLSAVEIVVVPSTASSDRVRATIQFRFANEAAQQAFLGGAAAERVRDHLSPLLDANG